MSAASISKRRTASIGAGRARREILWGLRHTPSRAERLAARRNRQERRPDSEPMPASA